MDRTERFYKIDQMLRGRLDAVPISEFLDVLGVSLASFKRDLAYMRDRLYAPIEWDRDKGGYRLVEARGRGPKYELPGLWFSPSEAQALLTMEHLIESLEPTLLGRQLAPLKSRLAALLSSGDHSVEEVRRRIRVIPLGARRHEPRHFSVVAAAVLGRKRLELKYFNRMKNETTEREVSPQRLVYYRNNWYLDGYCHTREGLRTFALDAIKDVTLEERRAKDVPDKELDRVLASGYGIFAGTTVHWARLRFSAERSRYIALEEWHPEQKSRIESDGSLTLEVPYTDDKELVMDILKFGADVEVLQPPELRQAIKEAAARILSIYSSRQRDPRQ
ncbi:MAG TPA: YafY family protein [Usitatibacter sp.]|jgi:predicted DNA-binding transcriptional regulator YafY|nr:YafY family protein [Usitatibacter sp.]